MIAVTPACAADAMDWLPMRAALWPDCDDATHREEIAAWLHDPARFVALIARDGAGVALGFAEASVRHEYVNGSESSPVAFLEGLFVAPAARRRGVARALVAAVRDWARAKGLSELCSDTSRDNHASRSTHRALGFAETEVAVFFRQRLDGGDSPGNG